MVQLIKPFYAEGYAVSAPAYEVVQLDSFGDDATIEGDATSPIRVYEDGEELGPAHSTYLAVHDIGGGRYAHWKGRGLVFSSSDGSDPNTNGRKYFAVLPYAKPEAALPDDHG
ncbi:hypothetical protein JQ615_00220 [Bradyrhizobium jicamae]|uniref:Uncharacterized protein n=1 Tax=Bradyrhizobium jicamae TaxID=280332 RepID=A0ABS5FAR5_9BRAD|nr:hypothetical protein [Bradyrhizobium jicamae]MBR0793809.1 hypothetical protein [Bradyrhizobium jicamae]MBR0933417.1 hypothetical protein [Bradyrhizobium jicamae]